MQSIPQVQAERIYAHYVQKKSYFEIAAEEGVNKQTVYLSIQRGIAKIRKILVEPQKVDWRLARFCHIYWKEFSSFDSTLKTSQPMLRVQTHEASGIWSGAMTALPER